MGNAACCSPSKSQRETNTNNANPKRDILEAPQITLTGDATKDLRAMGFEFRKLPCDRAHDKENFFCSACETRLFHMDSGEMITAKNRKAFVPDGPAFDQVTNLCQEMVQEKLTTEDCYALSWVTLFDSYQGEAEIKALVDADQKNSTCEGDESQDADERPILIIVTGKGTSRAGIMSTKELLISGMEKGGAFFHVDQARKRNMRLILVDPNARGHHAGMETFERSMSALFDEESSTRYSDGPIYVLAHSAGGGQLVRYLLLGKARQSLLNRICAIAFTDSNHNIQWVRDDPRLFALLQSPACLYVRNNGGRVRAFDTFGEDNRHKKAGEEADGDKWWRHRFGRVRTVWAGTTEHSLMCWTAREEIWYHFDKNTKPTTLS